MSKMIVYIFATRFSALGNPTKDKDKLGKKENKNQTGEMYAWRVFLR